MPLYTWAEHECLRPMGFDNHSLRITKIIAIQRVLAAGGRLGHAVSTTPQSHLFASVQSVTQDPQSAAIKRLVAHAW